MQLDGDIIRRHRINLGMTQAQLAKKSGYDTRTIQRAEAGTPVLNQAAATIAQALDVNLDRIIPRQENLFDLPTGDEKHEVILLPCHSGRDLYRHLSKTDFLDVERDFEPRSEHREAVKRLGALIDRVWEDPWTPMMERSSSSPSEEGIFDCMIEASEIISELDQLGLRILTGSYTVRDAAIAFGEYGDPYMITGSPLDTDYSKLIVCLTDALDETLRRTPEDHYLSPKSIAEQKAREPRREIDDEIPF
jgi:transcriptional regulator with XRE-family HTH domain